MTTPDAQRRRRGTVLALTVSTVVLWLVALASGTFALVLLLGVEAPASRISFIVAAWFLTPAVLAMGSTVGLVAVRRSSRRVAVRTVSPPSGTDASP